MIPILQTKDSQIIQQNKMLMGGQTINLRARQLVYVLAALMDKDTPTATITVSAKEFLRFVNENSREKWTDLYRLTSDIFDHLNDNPILLRKPKSKDFMKINWLSSLGVTKGEIQARFSPDIAEYFLYKQGLPYTKLLWDIRAYKSNYTARILDLFQRHHIKESADSEVTFEYSIVDLKLFFGVHDSYPRFYDFEKRVLKVTAAELEKSDTAPYWFEYQKIKAGKSIKSIRFTVYIRPKVLLNMAPELARIGAGTNDQMSLFGQKGGWDLTSEGRKMVAALRKVGLAEIFALKVISNMTDSQSRAYYHMVKYGVNRSLAFNLVKDYCSFGELVGVEDFYVKYALEETERARIRRIVESRKGKTQKRITPDDKRGGLAKSVFAEQKYFPHFMEKLSSIRRENEINPPVPLIEKIER